MNKQMIAAVTLGTSMLFAVPAFATTIQNGDAMVKPTVMATTTPPNATAKIACVGAAVNTREAALDAAMTTFTGATNAAYSARASALSQAYTGTTTKSVAAAVRTAWSTFNTAEKSARKAWQSARDSAWKAYRTAAVACKAPAGTGDGANSELEASGN